MISISTRPRAALTEIYGHVNACHPFREGNGRTQRAFVRQLAAEAGWEIRWEDPAALANDRASFLDLAGKSDELNAMFTALLFRLPT
jgi:cell filamentation protein